MFNMLFILMYHPSPSGFAVVFAEDVPDVPSQDYTNGALNRFILGELVTYRKVVILDAWRNLCPTYNTFYNTSHHY
jgi:hypothetical protein